MRVGDYLRRIGYAGPIDLTAETLGALHRAHMTSVPFENLDIHLGVPIVLSVPAFYEKIVTRRRGGFCYELNGLFAWLLEELGFEVALHAACVASGGRLSPEFDHLVLSVALGDRWIADVGFGESSLDPLREGVAGPYSIGEEGEVRIMRRGTEPQYVFTLAKRRLDEFAARCLFQQTSPESHFTRTTICSLPASSGRVSVSGPRLIETVEGRRDERAIADRDDYRRILSERFGIELTAGEAERLLNAGVPE
ncbi:MAG TPA: arylamine N-acetyltransferase [Candidatus Polarisedimenticolaceae bacterium]|nr:arylamine N-acetyltransferase [Candidatus Polarisedimenticolaceae bacterium]